MAHRLTAAASVLLILLLGWAGWTRVSVPSDGTVVQLSNAVWQQDRITIAFELCGCSDLRPGDRVLAVAGREAGGYVYTVLRGGVLRDVQVVRPVPPSWAILLRTAWSPLLTVLLMVVVGWFVFAHRRWDPAARVLLLAASLFGFGTTTWLFGDTALRLATAGPRPIDVAGEVALALVWGAAGHFALVLPSTSLRAPPGVVSALYVAPLALHAAYLAVVLPRAEGRLEALGRAAQVSLVPSLVMPVVAVALMVLGYRRTADRIARLRLRWVLVTFLASAVAVLVLWNLPMLSGRPFLQVTLMPTALLPPVVALAAAVLRYRLFDIEIIVRRSLLYGGLTVCILAIYLSAASLFGHLIGAGPGLAAVFATCLVAFSVQPIRDWLQARIGRLVWGERDNPYGLVSRLSRVDVAADPQVALAEVGQTLGRALRLAYVGIELSTSAGRVAVSATFGVPSGPPRIIPLRRGAEPIGRLLLDVGRTRQPLGPADRRLLDALTRHLVGAAAVVLLNAELRESRQRLVMAREEERRRIAHALHEGLEAGLTEHTAQLREARDLLGSDPQRAVDLLAEAAYGTRVTIGQIRTLVVGLRPPTLDQLGLIGAIRERARAVRDESGAGGPPLDVTAENDLGALPAAVEVAAFWIAIEAVRHAESDGRSTEFRVVLARRDDLFVRLGNAGGFRSGPGLGDALRRAEELGGTAVVTATEVRARLPIRERTSGDGK